MLGRIRASIHERARYLTKKCELARLLADAGISEPWSDSTELLQTMLSIRSLIADFPNILIDVGAHHGGFSAAALLFFNIDSVICFEPDKELGKTILQRLPHGKTQLFQFALSDTVGSATLMLHKDKTMNSLKEADSRILSEKFRSYDSGQIERCQVETRTLDDVLATMDLKSTDRFFLKLDTQGTELEILRGSQVSLEKVDCCLIEYMFMTPYLKVGTFEELVLFLAGRGFRCVGPLSMQRRVSHEVSGVDFLFVRAG